MCRDSNLEPSYKIKLESHSKIIWNILVRKLFSLPVVQSGSYLYHRMPMVKWCAMSLNKVCMSMVRVTPDHTTIFSSEHICYPLSPLSLILLSKEWSVTLNQISRSKQNYMKYRTVWNILTRSLFSLHLVQSYSYFMHKVTLFKKCAVTLNHLRWSSVIVMLDHP